MGALEETGREHASHPFVRGTSSGRNNAVSGNGRVGGSMGEGDDGTRSFRGKKISNRIGKR